MNPRLRVAIVLVAVFAAGAAGGAAADHLMRRPPVVQPTDTGGRRAGRRTGDRESPDIIPFPLVALGLTDSQTTELHAIARQWRPRAGEELKTFSARVTELENGMFADMLCILTPAQRSAYEAELRKTAGP